MTERLYREDPPVARLGAARVREALAPRSIAIVGASDNSAWSAMTIAALDRFGPAGPVHLVNRRGAPAHGRATAKSCADIGEPVDLAMMLVANAAIPDALREAAAAGVRTAVLLGSGYAEVAHGVEAQRELVTLAHELDLAVIGPNGQGFINVVDRGWGWTALSPDPLIPGHVAIVSQSGNLTLTLGQFAGHHGIGISHMVATGNELNIDILDVMDALVDDERVRVLAVFAESIRDPGLLADVARRAAELRKPIVMLKVGASEAAARAALTHTGALVGDDSVVDAGLRRAGVIRVGSLEQLMLTSGLLAYTGPLRAGGLGIASISGGANDIVADRAEVLGVPLPEFAEETCERIREHMADFATVQNPFDVTGGAVGAEALVAEPLKAIGDDPGVAIVAYGGWPYVSGWPDVRADKPVAEHMMSWVGAGLSSGDTPGVLLLNVLDHLDREVLDYLRECSIPHVVQGMELGMQAIADAMRWSRWLAEHPGGADGGADKSPVIAANGELSWSEAKTLALLLEHGVPTVPWTLASSSADAVAAAEALGYPVVVKVVAASLLHKSDIGGVLLSLMTPDDVARAFDEVTAAAARNGVAAEGVIVAPMREPGTELILGAVRDESWGTVLMVGLGGLHAEAVADTVTGLLPMGEPDIRALLGSLRGGALFDGSRGSAPVDLDALVDAVVAFSELAVRLSPALESMEINPLRASGSTIEALDAVATWRAT